MDWRKIPSLSALRAFEAAARLRSFSGAARELNVTQPAIAQHVRALEQFFGQPLMERQGQEMNTTATGLALAQTLSDGFGTIAAGIVRLQEDIASRPLKISVTPAFAENWLMPRLGSFWSAYPDIRIELSPSEELVDLRRDGFDLAIRYGKGDWDGYDATRLAPAHYSIVGTQELLSRAPSTDLDGLRQLPWLMRGASTEIDEWINESQIDLDGIRKMEFPTNSMILAACRASVGISIQSRAVVENDLRLGTLQVAYQIEDTARAYYLVTQPNGHSEKLDAFTVWIKSQV